MNRLNVGDLLPELRVAQVSADKMKIFAALIRDANPIHLDGAAAATLGMGDRPVNQGPINMAYVIDMLAAWSGDPYAIESLSVRFTGNVLAGDAVRAGGRVTAIDDGVADCQVWLDVDAGARALEGSARVRLAR